jgi:pimeloyl-ACP methyl ester carboxylesterase
VRPDAPRDPDLRRVDVGSAIIGYTETGSGRPVVAVHGLPASLHDFRWLDAALLDRVRLFRLDLPGFGDSPIQDPRAATLETMAGVVSGFCDSLDLREAILLGHSLGGPIVARAALDSDRVAGVALVNSAGPVMHRGDPWRTLRVLLALVDLHPSLRRLVLSTTIPIARRVGFSKHISEDSMILACRLVSRYMPSTTGRLLASLDKPTLVAWPRKDPAVQPKVTRGILAALRQASELRIDAKTHNLQATHACEVADGLVAWIDEVVSTPA